MQTAGGPDFCTPTRRRPLRDEETPERLQHPRGKAETSMWEEWGVADYGEWDIVLKDLQGPTPVCLDESAAKGPWPIDAEYAAIGQGELAAHVTLQVRGNPFLRAFFMLARLGCVSQNRHHLGRHPKRLELGL
ncbi:unnamed protein product [Effrenium voratum]|uniref:Uncharacterized protein n=1 Tax=Effrenium voratum TaxID=2562239 RepID=A0AA36JHG9_9DINO|nr:unnamed protein product [Effrenium voratum]CAJ1405510.1 unnamed protein product [Effrenium voratum]CAJ1429826.1 unnamed protein product [Effrenium voratum]